MSVIPPSVKRFSRRGAGPVFLTQNRAGGEPRCAWGGVHAAIKNGPLIGNPSR